MKIIKNAVICLVFISLPLVGKSQGEMSLEKGDVLINPAITLGEYSYSYIGDRQGYIPPVSLNFEYALSSYLSWGLEGEYTLRKYRDFGFISTSNEYRYERISVGVRGSFHYLDLLKNLLGDKLGGLNSDKFDFYLTAVGGYTVFKGLTTWNDGVTVGTHELKTFDSGTFFGGAFGFRYYFKPALGAFFEGGQNSFGYGKIGLTFKF